MIKRALIFLVMLFCAFLFLAFLYLKEEIYGTGPLEAPVNVVVEKGDGVKRIAWILFKNKVIKSQYLFEFATKVYEFENSLKAGEYRFEPKISLYEAMQQIAQGKVYLRKITLPEGLTTKQMLAIIANDDNLGGELTLTPKEGEMLPETYTFSHGDSKDSIVKQATDAMNKFVKANFPKNRNKQIIKNEKELLILASIVEKETGLKSERGLVASVFLNRLKKGMLLQTDPTVIYALTKGQFELGRSLNRKDLKIDDAYNTYVYAGLPPTPICSPSKEAIMAVLEPEESKYLYFVATGDGGHNFSENLNKHNNHVAEYVRKLKQKRKKK